MVSYIHYDWICHLLINLLKQTIKTIITVPCRWIILIFFAITSATFLIRYSHRLRRATCMIVSYRNNEMPKVFARFNSYLFWPMEDNKVRLVIRRSPLVKDYRIGWGRQTASLLNALSSVLCQDTSLEITLDLPTTATLLSPSVDRCRERYDTEKRISHGCHCGKYNRVDSTEYDRVYFWIHVLLMFECMHLQRRSKVLYFSQRINIHIRITPLLILLGLLQSP